MKKIILILIVFFPLIANAGIISDGGIFSDARMFFAEYLPSFCNYTEYPYFKTSSDIDSLNCNSMQGLTIFLFLLGFFIIFIFRFSLLLFDFLTFEKTNFKEAYKYENKFKNLGIILLRFIFWGWGITGFIILIIMTSLYFSS